VVVVFVAEIAILLLLEVAPYAEIGKLKVPVMYGDRDRTRNIALDTTSRVGARARSASTAGFGKRAPAEREEGRGRHDGELSYVWRF
jgi:hypothetical protein